MHKRLFLTKWLVVILFLTGLLFAFYGEHVPSFLLNYYGFYQIFLSIIIIILIEEAEDKASIFRNMKRTYTKMKRRSDNMERVLNNLEVAICLRNPDGHIIYFNYFFAKMTLSKRQPISAKTSEIDEHATKMAKIAQIRKQDQKNERYIVINGKRHLFQFTDHYIKNTDQVTSVAYDITSKSEISKALAETTSAQEELLDSNKNATIVFGPDRRVKLYNKAYKELWNLKDEFLKKSPTYEEILNHLYFARRLPEYADFRKFRDSRLSLFTKLTNNFQDYIHLTDGRSLKLLVVPHSLGGLLFSFEDLTEHFALRASYKSLSQVYISTIEHLQEAICIFDEAGFIKYYNSKFITLWNLDKETLLLKTSIFEVMKNYNKLFSNNQLYLQHKNFLLNHYNKRSIATEQILINQQNITRTITPLPDGSTMISDCIASTQPKEIGVAEEQ